MPKLTALNECRERRISTLRADRLCHPFARVWVVVTLFATFSAAFAQDQPSITAPPLGVGMHGSVDPVPSLPAMSAVQSPNLDSLPGESVLPPIRSLPSRLEPIFESPASSESQSPATTAKAAPVEPRRSRAGDDLVRQASERLAGHKTVQAMLRQTVNMFGRSVVGKGAYHQSRRGSNLLLRLDLQLQLDDRAATFQQISDGRFLWRFVDSPDVRKLGVFKQELSRVDLDVVRRATPISQTGDALSAASFSGIGYGGLPQLTRQLVHNFTFDVPQSGTWQGVPVWMLNGEWYEPALRRVIAAYDDSKSETGRSERDEFSRLLANLPMQFPHDVVLILGKEDLFPYRIVYRRSKSDEAATGIIVTSNNRQIVTLDLFQVQYDSPVDASQFVRRAGDLQVRDATAEFLDKHGLVYREAKTRLEPDPLR